MAGELPGLEKRSPVDPLDQLREGIVVEDPHAGEAGHRWGADQSATRVGARGPMGCRASAPVRSARSRRSSRYSSAASAMKSSRGCRAEEAARYADRARGVQHVDDGRRYCGAIFTAVCALEVVAPPISSGS